MDFRWNDAEGKKAFLIGGGIGIPPMVRAFQSSFTGEKTDDRWIP